MIEIYFIGKPKAFRTSEGGADLPEYFEVNPNRNLRRDFIDSKGRPSLYSVELAQDAHDY